MWHLILNSGLDKPEVLYCGRQPKSASFMTCNIKKMKFSLKGLILLVAFKICFKMNEGTRSRIFLKNILPENILRGRG